MWHGTFKKYVLLKAPCCVTINCALVKMQIGVISVISVITKLMIVKYCNFVGS